MTGEAISRFGVNVQCLDALEGLCAALGRFGIRGESCLQDYERKYQGNWAELMNSLESRMRKVATIEDELAYLDNTPDEETGEDPNAERRGELEDDLSRARERVDDLEAVMRQVQGAYEDFQRRTAEFNALAGEHIPRSQTILRQHIDAIAHYRSVRADLSQGLSPRAGTASTLSTASAAPKGGNIVAVPGQGFPESFNDYPLPPDFQWVLLDDINLDRLEEVADKSEYKKVKYDTMRHGMELLQTRILPKMAEDLAGATHDYFHELDQQEGLAPGEGLEAVYDAFFTPAIFRHREVIHLDKGSGKYRFDITDGRHRIRLAKELGWRAIPVPCGHPDTGENP